MTVRIEGVSPRFDKTGLVHLTLICHGKSKDSMVQTIDDFNADGHFANPFPSVETMGDRETQFTIDVDYRPAIARGGGNDLAGEEGLAHRPRSHAGRRTCSSSVT